MRPEQIVKGCRSDSGCAGTFPDLKVPPPGFDDFSRIGCTCSCIHLKRPVVFRGCCLRQPQGIAGS
jgi:hypothetical protein